MKKRSILTKISLAVLLAGGTLAGHALANAAVYTPTKVGCFDNGTCYIVTSPAIGNWSGPCASGNSQVRWKLSAAGGTEMYRTALAAFMAGRTLDINTYNGAVCTDGFPTAFYLNAN